MAAKCARRGAHHTVKGLAHRDRHTHLYVQLRRAQPCNNHVQQKHITRTLTYDAAASYGSEAAAHAWSCPAKADQRARVLEEVLRAAPVRQTSMWLTSTSTETSLSCDSIFVEMCAADQRGRHDGRLLSSILVRLESCQRTQRHTW